MERPAAVVGNVVGDIDERVDRAKPDRFQPPLQPLGRRAVLDAAHEPPGEDRASIGVRFVEFERDRDRVGEAAFDGAARVRLEFPEPGRREVAGDAADAKTVGTVRRDGDVKHRVIEAERPRRRTSDLGIGRKLDDAGMLVREFELALRKQHAVRTRRP